MKKLLLSLIVASMFLSPVFGQSRTEKAIGTTNLTLIGLPTLSWAHTNSNGEIMGYNGVNLALGFSSLNYMKPQKVDDINTYWHWGTVILLVPYIGAGVEYTMSNGFYAAIETFYLAPTIKAGMRF